LSCSFPPSLSSCVLRLLALHSFPTRRSSDLPPLVEQLSDSCYCYTQYDGCLERRTVDSCGNSMCLKTPQSGFLEEAEAVPAESNGSQRKTTQRLLHSLYQLRIIKATIFLNCSHSPKTYERNLLFKLFTLIPSQIRPTNL